MSLTYEDKLHIKKKTHKQLMWVGLLSLIMFFGGLSSAYIVQRADGTWVKIFLPQAFYISSIIIVISSITYFFAVRLIKKGDSKKASILILATLILGFAFVGTQYTGWKELTEKGHYLGGLNKVKYVIQNKNSVYGEDYIVMYKGEPLQYQGGKFYNQKDRAFEQPINYVNLEAGNNASSYMYLLTGLHVVHLIAGLISLIFVFIRNLKGKYTKNDNIGVQVSAIYWHFLDFLWLYLLGILYFLG